MNNALISVVIPAYNLPEYTAKTIDSIMSQTYRPIEIVISDDNSPISLKSLVKAKKDKCDAGINIKYFRQQINLGYYWNLQFVLNEAVGKYLVLLDHDDWLIDPDFFSEAVKAMDGKPDCFLSICNTLPEKTPYPFLDISYENWHYVNSGKFIKNNLFKKIHPSRSAVMMRFDKLRELDYKNYFIDHIFKYYIHQLMTDPSFSQKSNENQFVDNTLHHSTNVSKYIWQMLDLALHIRAY